MKDIKNDIFTKLNETFDLDSLSEEEISMIEKHIDRIISNARKLSMIQDSVINDKDKLEKFSELLIKTIGKV